MALFAALCAVVRVDIARAEPASCARETDRFALVFLGIVQHILVELVSLQHVVASVAAPSFSVPPALDAVFRIRFEAFGDLLNTARGACVARYTTQCPILGFVSRTTPLAVAKLFSLEPLAAYCAGLPGTALCTCSRSLGKLIRALAPLAAGTGVAPGASQEPIAGVLRP